jgi:uncharacterized cupredoxin-like copper-binding protein
MKRLALIGGVALAALSLAGCEFQASAAENTVHVTIHFSRFEPASFHFTKGETVTFVVRNLDPIDHEFLVGDEAVQALHESGTEAHHGAKPGEISVPARSTATTTYTFSEATPLIVGCHLPGHYAYGMRAPITITDD